MRSNPCRSSPASTYMLSVKDFDLNGTISEVRVHAGLYLDIPDAGRSPNAADSQRSSRAPHCLITMEKLKEAKLAISWQSWLQKILLDVALVLDSVLLFFKYHGWERERTSWSEKRKMRSF